MRGGIRRKGLVMAALLAAVAAGAADDWVIFKGQVDGPGKAAGMDLETFRLRRYDGLFWTEGYYHHLNFPGGEMITVSVGVNRSEVNIAVVYAQPGMEPYRDYVIADADEAKFDPEGFGITVGNNRARLDRDRYTLDLSLPRTKMKIALDPLAPSLAYGDGMVRYPDGDTYMYYSLPIPWARARVEATLDGKEVKLAGWGNMNHDAGVIFPANIPANWQVFWFFGEDHALLVTDYFTREKFGKKPVRRLALAEAGGRTFTATSFDLAWDDWADASGIRFKYPRKFHLRAEAGGATLTGEVRMKEALLLEDLFSNLPEIFRAVAERVTRNGWTFDAWSEYTLTYTEGGAAREYRGTGVTRYMDLEAEAE